MKESDLNPTRPEFSVYQFFVDGTREEIRFVDGETAIKRAHQWSHSVGAKMGTTQRVIITDGGDCINFEWIYGSGVTFPPELADFERQRSGANGGSKTADDQRDH
jgi:hypothetical protein